MDDAVYKHINIVGTSTQSVEGAIEGAVAKAAETVKNISWFEVVDIRGHIDNGKVTRYQVGVKLGFKLD
ncbi:dodecin [Hoeflea sp.]|uniref:dodecin n=1 Tax=Hoeflea sp. TaxID=1940281 RepID=UPI003B012948